MPKSRLVFFLSWDSQGGKLSGLSAVPGKVRFRRESFQFVRFSLSHFPLRLTSPHKIGRLSWVRNHEHVFVLGPTGVGKSLIACALAQKACRDGYSALYVRAPSLFRELARADGSLRHYLTHLNRIDVLVIDDWAMAPLSETERRDFWEISEDRYQTRSFILASQLPVARWHEQIGYPTVADGILDRLVHNAHRIEMRGDSMRKVRSSKEER